MPTTNLLEVTDQRDAIAKMMDEAHKALLKSEDEIATDLLQTYQRNLDQLINDLKSLNVQYLNGESPQTGAWLRSVEHAKSLQLINERMGHMHDEVVNQLMDGLQEFYKTAYDHTSWAVDQASPPNVDVNYNLPSDAFIRSYVSAPWKGSMFSDKQWVITNNMATQMQTTLLNSINSGDSVDEFARKIRNLTGVPDSEKLITRPRASAQMYRALLIARTEMIRVSRLSQKMVFDQNKDIVTGMVWTMAPMGIRVCEDCQARDGMTRDEIENGEAADDLDVDPPGHPACRCFWRPEMKSWKDMLGNLGKGMGDLEHIDEWEMMYPDAQGTGMAKVAITPYEEWAA